MLILQPQQKLRDEYPYFRFSEHGGDPGLALVEWFVLASTV